MSTSHACVFSCVWGCYDLFTHVKTSNVDRKHIPSSHAVRLRTALWGIQGCLSSTPRKQINRAQGRVSRAPPLGLPLHSLPCCFNVRICNIQKLNVFNTFLTFVLQVLFGSFTYILQHCNIVLF